MEVLSKFTLHLQASEDSNSTMLENRSEASMSECLSELATPTTPSATPTGSSPDKRGAGPGSAEFKLGMRRKSSSQDLMLKQEATDPNKRWRGTRW